MPNKNLNIVQNSNNIKQKKMVLIAGDGRNVGKTHLACELINRLAKSKAIIGIKTSPHFHALKKNDEILFREEEFIIIKEKNKDSKDSSLMLQAGANVVYFVMCKQEALQDAFNKVATNLGNSIIIAESGGLNEIIEPALFIFVKEKNKEVSKTHYLKHDPLIIERGEKGFNNIDIEDILSRISKL